MKKVIFLLAFCFSLGNLKAQESSDDLKDLPKNFVRFNLTSLIASKYSFEYERLFTKRLAVGIAYTTRPKNSLPFKSEILDIIDDEEMNNLLSDFKTSSTSFTPEVRFYLSRRGYGKGFYIAPYAKFAKFNVTTPYHYDVEIEVGGEQQSIEKDIELDGKLNTFTAGLTFGFNIKVIKNFYLDWRLIGPGYGSSKGDITGKMTLSAEEQEGLNEQLASLQESLDDLPVKINMDYSVNGQGAEIKITNSPWANFRSGISLAYRF